jgi:hypothetical protein
MAMPCRQQFIDFLDDLLKNKTVSMPISSQASWEQEEGSETRVYDPKRIMELQERVKKASIILSLKLADAQKREQNESNFL